MTRKSLRTKRIFSIILSLAVALTMMPMSALAADGTSTVENAVAIDGAEKYYLGLQDAFAGVEDHGTVRMLKPLGDKMISFCKDTNGEPVDKTVTLMMNGHSLSYEGATSLYIQSGKLIIGDDAVISQTEQTAQPAVFVDNHDQNKDRGTLEFKGKATLTGGLFIQNWGKLEGGLKEGSIITRNGTYSVSVEQSTNTYSNVLGLLGDGLAFANYDKSAGNKAGALVDGSVKQLTEDVIVVAHTTHTMGKDNKCACGFTCPHNAFENGVCTICGNACAHTNVGENGVCENCKTQMTVKITASDNTVTYGTDFKAAMRNATNGTKITLLADVSIAGRTGISGNDTTVTLDLNEHKITGGWLDVGDKDTNGTYTTCTLKIIGKGSYEPPQYGGIITVNMKATLDLSEWEGGTISSINISDRSDYEAASREAAVIVGPKAGTIGKLSFGNNQLDKLKKTKLSGGSFNEIWVADFGPVKLGELLADGYAYQYTDGVDRFVEYTTTLQGASIYNVKVVKCLHPNMKPDATTGTVTCEYCGKSGKFAASVDGNLYTDMDAAITDWLAKGGTLKLYADYTAADGTWKVGSGSHTVNLNGHRMSVKDDGAFFKPTNNMHLTVTDDTERGQIENILLDGSQGGSFTLENGYVGNLEMTGGAVVTLKGGRVDKLDVQNCSANTNLSIQGGSLGKLNIKDWADGMHVSATGGSLGAYTLPSGKILADVLDHQYYAEGTSLDKSVDTAQPVEKFVINQAPHDFGSTSKAADVPINGSIPFRVDSPSENVGVYDVKWYRRTDSGAVHMTENKVNGVKVGDTLDVFCVITGLDRPNNGTVLWQVAVKGYTINVVPANLNGDQTVITQKPNTGNTGNSADNRLVVTPFSSSDLSDVKYQFEVTYNRQPLELNKDYIIKDSSNLARNAGTHTLTIVGMGNYTGEKAVTWTLEPYELSVENFRYAQIDKMYDGTDAVTDRTNGITGLDGFILDSKNPRNPNLSNVANFNLHTSDYQLSNMKFDSAEAGDRTLTGTMTLTSGGNFVFAGGNRVMQIEYSSDGNGRQVVVINRAIIAAPATKALQVANNHAATYTVDLSALLPKLESPKKYGEVTYELGTDAISFGADGYYEAGTAKIEGDKLILPIQAVKTDTTGSIGAVKVKVSTTNYHDFTLTINVNATNKIVPTGTPTLSKTTLAWGEQLSTISLSGAMTDPTDSTKTVKGKFEWVTPETKMETVGDYQAEWKFTPTDTDVYAETSGKVKLTVTKATPTGAPKYTAITKEGQTLADANLTAVGENNESLFKALGKAIRGIVKWVESEDKTTELNSGTKVEQGKTYTWLFTPTEADNYSTLTGTIVLWAKPSSGGGAVAPAPTTPDTDVVTEKDSQTGVSEGSDTTTKTTVKESRTETAKNEQGQTVSKTTASVSKETAAELVRQATEHKSDTVEITVKSGTTAAEANGVKSTELAIPKTAVEEIAKNTDADLVIKTDSGEVTLDNKTLETIAKEAKSDTARIVVNENTKLTEAQKPAEKIIGEKGKLFDLAASIGEKLIHHFGGGKAHVTLPMPEGLKGKDVLVIYINDKGFCEILNHTVEKVGADSCIKFTTSHFSTFAVVDKEEAEALIKAQNEAHVKELMQNGKFKVTTTKTSKKSVKVTVTAKNSKTLISDIKTMGYTVKYQFYRSTKKTSGYKLLKTKTTSSFTNTKGKKGTKYYYKARVLVYDGKTLIAKSQLKQASCGVRTWTK